MSEIKAAIFDVGGVLSDEGLQAMLEDMKASLNVDDQTLKEIFSTHIPHIESGKVDEAEFWKQITEVYGTRYVDISENLLGRAYADSLKPQAEVLELVRTLGGAGITMAILSNTIEQHAKPLRAAGVYSGFDYIFLSHEIGYRKPDPKAYEYVLQELNVTPGQALFVDDREENVEAANQLGMHGIVFTSPQKLTVDVQALLPDLVLSR